MKRNISREDILATRVITVEQLKHRYDLENSGVPDELELKGLSVTGDIYEGGVKLSEKYGGSSAYPDWSNIQNKPSTYPPSQHTHSYTVLNDKPQINSVTLEGNKSLDDLNIQVKGNYVAQESGKGLSTNDYTTVEKNKLAGIASGAQVNVIESVKVNGTALTVTSKAVDVPVPTNTSDLTNDSNFVSDANYSHITVDSSLSSSSTNPVQNKVINTALGNKAALASPTFTGTPKAPTATAGTNSTQIATTAFVATAIANAISGITGISFEVVQTLPSTGDTGTIYLLANNHGSQDIYDEYIYVNNAWEKIGSTNIDLSDYMLKTDMVAITDAEIDAIVEE